jgi:hypothetical protein
MKDVYITSTNLYGGMYLYQIWCDGVVYDSMISRTGWLTWSQQQDIADGYREVLNSWEGIK